MKRSEKTVLGLTGIARERLWCRNIARVGHTLAGDNFINLRDAVSDGSVRPGDRLLLFSYGYGAHWTALLPVIWTMISKTGNRLFSTAG